MCSDRRGLGPLVKRLSPTRLLTVPVGETHGTGLKNFSLIRDIDCWIYSWSKNINHLQLLSIEQSIAPYVKPTLLPRGDTWSMVERLMKQNTPPPPALSPPLRRCVRKTKKSVLYHLQGCDRPRSGRHNPQHRLRVRLRARHWPRSADHPDRHPLHEEEGCREVQR